MLIFDLHEDISSYFLSERDVKDFNVDDSRRHVDLPKYRRAYVKYVVGAVFSGRKIFANRAFTMSFRDSFTITWDQIAFYHRLVSKYPNDLCLILNRQDLEEVLKNNKIGLIIGIEGAYSLDNPWDLELYYKLGVRVIGLTWNIDNKYAASCLTEKDYGLTGLGEKLVNLALDLGMVVDLAHASKRTVLDVLSIMEKPAIISHAGVKALYNTARNVDDDVIDALRKNKGVLGIFFYTEALSRKKVDVNSVAKHIMYVYENFGADVPALGTDYLGIRKTPKGLETIDKILNLVEKLKELGLSKEDIEKIAYKNALRVFMENLKKE